MIAKKKDIIALRTQTKQARVISMAGVAVSRTVAGTSVRPLRKRSRRGGGGSSGAVPRWG